MKRRKFLYQSAIGGLGFVFASQCLSAWGDDETDIKSPPLFSFVALGDVGTGNIGQLAVADAMDEYYRQNPFALVLLTGDNIYEDGEIEKVGKTFGRPYRFLRRNKVPFYAVLGNHDIRTNNGVDQVNYSAFNMKGRYYTWEKDIVQFFALDTNHNASWSKQLAWLEKGLASSNAVWKIVFAHHPVYSSGVHGSSDKLIERLSPLFERYGVQLYLNGHDHNYERTQPIADTTYLTCGAGAKLRPVGKSDWTAHSVAKLSFATIDVYPQYLDIRGIGKNGKVFDRAKVALNNQSNS